MDPNIPTQPIQNEIPAAQPNLQQPANEIPKSKSKFKLILLIIILLILVGSGAYLLGAKQNNSIVQKQITPTITQSNPTPAPDPIANWKTYQNNQYGFEIKYPINLDNLINSKDFDVFRNLKVSSETKNGSNNPYKGKSCPGTCGIFSEDTNRYLKQFALLEQIQNSQDCSLNQDYINDFKKNFILFFVGAPLIINVQGVILEKQCGVKYVVMDGYQATLNIFYYRVAYIKDNKAVNISFPLFPDNRVFSQVDKLYSSMGYSDGACVSSSCPDKKSNYINKITTDGGIVRDNVAESVIQIYDQILSTFKFTD